MKKYSAWQRRIIIFAILIATFMTSVETTIISTALPTIVSDLNGLSLQSWVFGTYLLTTAITTPIYGKLSDRCGRKPIILIGIVLFITGSFLCGVAPNISLLILSRGIQGIGAGAIIPMTFTMIADMFSYEKRSTMLALNNTSWGISALSGPLVGGYIVDTIGWHWVFFINIPFGIIALVILYTIYKENVTYTVKKPIDIKGSLSLSLLLLSTLLLFQTLSSPTGKLMTITTLFILIVLSFIAFYISEKKAVDPVIPLQMFQNRLFSIQITTAMILSAIQIGFQNYFPIWLQSLYKVKPFIAGLSITPSPIFWLFASFLVGGIVKKYAPKHIAMLLIAVMGLSYLPLLIIGASAPKIIFYVIAAITGVCLGTVITMNTLVSQRVAAKENIGVASSMLTLGRSLGQTLAMGIFGLIFNTSVAHELSKHSDISFQDVTRAMTSAPQAEQVTSSINTTILYGMHAVFIAVMLLFIFIFVVNLKDKNKNVIL